jgi:hypothetical protein
MCTCVQGWLVLGSLTADEDRSEDLFLVAAHVRLHARDDGGANEVALISVHHVHVNVCAHMHPWTKAGIHSHVRTCTHI